MIEDLLNQKLSWKPIVDSKRDFYNPDFSTDECYLRMNNFPDEPLWTLFYKGDSLDFDNTPVNWDILYRSEGRVSTPPRRS